jgi:hypothetical protein
MAITLNTGFLKTIPGILKIVEFILVLIVLLIARFGVDDDHVRWYKNTQFLGIGASVGYAIIIPAIILTYLLGSIPSVLEFIINLIGGILFIAMGALMVDTQGITRVVGGLAIALGIIFLIDFIYLCVTSKYTVYQRTANVHHTTATVQHTTRTFRS